MLARAGIQSAGSVEIVKQVAATFLAKGVRVQMTLCLGEAVACIYDPPYQVVLIT